VTVDTLTRRQLNRATLARQLLLARERMSAVEAVERLCGMQAQEAKPPFVGLWTRVEGFRREDLHAALREREVVRAMAMRATLQLMSARDYRAHRMALQPVMTQAMRVLRERAEGLDLEKLLPAARTLLRQETLPRHAVGELAEEGEALLRFAEAEADRFDIEVIQPP